VQYADGERVNANEAKRSRSRRPSVLSALSGAGDSDLSAKSGVVTTAPVRG
jgi:hypothetical protein